MKKPTLLLLLFTSLLAFGQMTESERQLRKNADFTAFLKDVKKNSKQNCLCTANEYAVYSFGVQGGKIASVCVSKNVSETSGYLVYRFGTKSKTEFTFPADTLNSFSRFSFAHYNRGGGKRNAAMYLNILRFTNGAYEYTLRDDWSSEDNRYSRGVDASTNAKTSSFDAKGKVTGTLYTFVNRNLVPESEEL